MELESPSLQLPRCAVQAINFVGKTLLESDDTLFLATECTIFVLIDYPGSSKTRMYRVVPLSALRPWVAVPDPASLKVGRA